MTVCPLMLQLVTRALSSLICLVNSKCNCYQTCVWLVFMLKEESTRARHCHFRYLPAMGRKSTVAMATLLAHGQVLACSTLNWLIGKIWNVQRKQSQALSLKCTYSSTHICGRHRKYLLIKQNTPRVLSSAVLKDFSQGKDKVVRMQFI